MTTIHAELRYDDDGNPYVVTDQDPADRSRLEQETNWAALGAMNDEETLEAARSDPDAQPSTPEQRRRWIAGNGAGRVRHTLALTQEQFADRFGIPLGTLRDWEQGRREPDATARTLLRAIAMDPELIARAVDRDRVRPARNAAPRSAPPDRGAAK